MEQQKKEKIFTEVTTMAHETREPAPDREALFSFLDQPKLGSNVPGNIQKINKAIALKIGKNVPDVPSGVNPSDPEVFPDVQNLSDRDVYTNALDSAIQNNATSRAIEKISEMSAKTAEAKAPEKTAPAAPAKSGGGMMI